jgi:hypothetical protein
VLRRIFGPTRQKETGGWGKLHNEQIHNLYSSPNTTGVWKVRELTLLLRVGTLWRCGDGLFFEALPLASDAHLTTLQALLENVLQTVDHFEISCFGAPFSWSEKPKNSMGRDLDCVVETDRKVDGWNPIRTSEAPLEAWGKRSAARFREVGGTL